MVAGMVPIVSAGMVPCINWCHPSWVWHWWSMPGPAHVRPEPTVPGLLYVLRQDVTMPRAEGVAAASAPGLVVVAVTIATEMAAAAETAAAA